MHKSHTSSEHVICCNQSRNFNLGLQVHRGQEVDLRRKTETGLACISSHGGLLLKGLNIQGDAEKPTQPSVDIRDIHHASQP